MATIGFDLDGVLIRNPFGSHVFPAFHRAMRGAPLLRGLDETVVHGAVTRAVRAHWGELMRRGELVAAYDWDATFRAVAEEFGGTDVPDVAALVREGCLIEGAIAALPHAEQTLAALAGAGHRLVVVTNGYAAFQEPVLAALGLLPYFERVVTPDRVGAAKPQAAAFAAAGGLDWFVGDTLVHDVHGARAAGVGAVWLDAGMPDELAGLPARERSARAELGRRVEEALAASPYAAYHPEATAESCMPTVAIKCLAELPGVVGGG